MTQTITASSSLASAERNQNAMIKESLESYKFMALCMCLDDMHCSYKKAVKIVGGEKRLGWLMDTGKVRYDKPIGARNTMWRFNLSDIIRYVNPRIVKQFSQGDFLQK